MTQSNRRKYIFRYDKETPGGKLVVFNDLNVLVEEIGWVRGQEHRFKVIDTKEPSLLVVAECAADGTPVINGRILEIDFIQFYQGDKLVF